MPDGSLIFTETQANRITQDRQGQPDLDLSREHQRLERPGVRQQGPLDLGADHAGQDADRRDLSRRARKPRCRTTTTASRTAGPTISWSTRRAASISASPDPTRRRASRRRRRRCRPRSTTCRRAASRSGSPKASSGPNGIQLSPDEKTLYVNNTNGEYVLAFDIKPDGTVGNRRNFAKYPNVDEDAGRRLQQRRRWPGHRQRRAASTWSSTGGVHVFSPKGDLLGTIPVSLQPQNIAFAGADKKTLYIVGRGSAFKVRLLAEGYKGGKAPKWRSHADLRIRLQEVRQGIRGAGASRRRRRRRARRARAPSSRS